MNYLQYSRKRDKRKAFLAVVGAFLLILACPMWMKLYVSQASAPEKYEERIVVAGDTLWEYAKEKCGAKMDVRKYVNKTIELNSLDSPKILIGQRILLPIGLE